MAKGKLLALLLVFGAVGTLAATGAFTTVEAERTADVNVAGDANALLQIVPNETEGDTSFIQQNNTGTGTFVIDLSGNGDAQLNQRGTTTSQDLFDITNNGNESVDVWINPEGGAQAGNVSVNTTFYIDDEHIGSQINESSGSGTATDVSIDNRINEFDAFTDSNDVVISQNNTATADETPAQEGLAVEVGSGETVTVSMAIEIENSSNVGDGDEILNNVTIFAVNDNEQDITVDEGSTTT